MNSIFFSKKNYFEETLKHTITFLAPKYNKKKIAKKLYLEMQSIESMIGMKTQFELYCQYECFQPYKESVERLLNLM